MEAGSYSVDGRTCLYLMRNDKKRKRSRSVQMQGEFCFITSCFHWWFWYKKRLWVQKTQGANCTIHGWLQRREGKGGEGANALELEMRPRRGNSLPRPQWEARRPLLPASTLNGAQGLNEPGSLCPEVHADSSCSAAFGRTDCPGSHGQEAAYL